MMDKRLNPAGLKDAIGVLFLVITGLLYATGATEAATDVDRDVGLEDASVGATIEVPPDSTEALLI